MPAAHPASGAVRSHTAAHGPALSAATPAAAAGARAHAVAVPPLQGPAAACAAPPSASARPAARPAAAARPPGSSAAAAAAMHGKAAGRAATAACTSRCSAEREAMSGRTSAAAASSASSGSRRSSSSSAASRNQEPTATPLSSWYAKTWRRGGRRLSTGAPLHPRHPHASAPAQSSLQAACMHRMHVSESVYSHSGAHSQATPGQHAGAGLPEPATLSRHREGREGRKHQLHALARPPAATGRCCGAAVPASSALRALAAATPHPWPGSPAQKQGVA